MSLFEKLQSIFIIMAACAGLLLGQYDFLAAYSQHIVLPSLMGMLVIVFMNVPFEGIKRALLNTKFTSLTLSLNFLWTPLFAWLLGLLFLQDHPDLRIGFLMLLVTPCTDWYLVFTQLAGGDPTQASALLPWHLLLQILLLPLYLFVFAGTLVPLDIPLLLKSVSFVLLVPFVISFLVKRMILKIRNYQWFEEVFLKKISSLQFSFLCLAIVAMFCSQGETIINDPTSTYLLFIPLVIFYCSNLVIGISIAKLGKIKKENRKGFYFSTLARNSPLALVISITAFPEQPLISLALVIGSLIELPILALFASLLRKFSK